VRPAFLVAAAGLALAVLAASPLVFLATAAPPELPQPANLSVEGDEESWHADNNFLLGWDRVATPPLPFAVGYLVRDPGGSVIVRKGGIPGGALLIEHIRVSPSPGLYTAEVWFEGPHGEAGPAAVAALRFDGLAPGPARPVGPVGWVPASASVVLRIEHPPGPWPLSGIAGYAVSVDRGTGSSPCKGPARCTPEETDLSGGIDDDTISLGALPEGTTYVRVVAVSGSGVRSPSVEDTAIHVDGNTPEVTLHGAPGGWADRPVSLTATATDRLSGMAASGPAGPFTAISVDGEPPALAAGNTVSAIARGDGLHRIEFFARDAAGNVADGELGSPPPGEALVRIDETPPKVSFADSQDSSDPERIEASVADSLSGPDPSRGTIALRPAGSSQPFEPLPTQVSEGRLVARWDSDEYPDGSYEFRASGYDVAGNVVNGARRADGAPMVLANPVKEPTILKSGFGGRRLVWHRCVRGPTGRRCHRETIEGYERRPATRTVPFGRAIPFGGRLLTQSGAPLAGRPVTVVETFAPGSRPARRETSVRTDGDGAFLVRLPAGPTRRVQADFDGDGLLTRATCRPVRLAVLTPVRLRVSAATAKVGGAPVRFSGRVGDSGAAIPAGGMAVGLQFRLPGSGWTEFRTVQTDAAGRFRYPYGFSDDDSRGVRFQFRAFVAGQEGWPYEAAASRPVAVTGR
jgi:hypothetical protein